MAIHSFLSVAIIIPSYNNSARQEKIKCHRSKCNNRKDKIKGMKVGNFIPVLNVK